MRIRNWAKFQHYKDRKPQWIKLYRDLLDDIEWFRLSPDAAKALISLWLIGSETDGEIPSIKEVSFRLRITEKQTKKILDELFDGGFITDVDSVIPDGISVTTAKDIAEKNGFGSRYIPDHIKRQVIERDNGICKRCGSDERIEFDHVIPVSKGGNSDLANLQLLCRPCNRKKRTNIEPALSVAGSCAERSLEKEKETEKETERELSSKPAEPVSTVDRRNENPTPENLLQLWAITAKPLGLPVPRELTKDRKQKASLRLKEHPEKQFWDQVMAGIRGSPFLRGEKGWKASFDWLVANERNALKVVEGAYARESDRRPRFGIVG